MGICVGVRLCVVQTPPHNSAFCRCWYWAVKTVLKTVFSITTLVQVEVTWTGQES